LLPQHFVVESLLIVVYSIDRKTDIMCWSIYTTYTEKNQ